MKLHVAKQYVNKSSNERKWDLVIESYVHEVTVHVTPQQVGSDKMRQPYTREKKGKTRRKEGRKEEECIQSWRYCASGVYHSKPPHAFKTNAKFGLLTTTVVNNTVLMGETNIGGGKWKFENSNWRKAPPFKMCWEEGYQECPGLRRWQTCSRHRRQAPPPPAPPSGSPGTNTTWGRGQLPGWAEPGTNYITRIIPCNLRKRTPL